jgi:hypothetical protein
MQRVIQGAVRSGQAFDYLKPSPDREKLSDAAAGEQAQRLLRVAGGLVDHAKRRQAELATVS